MTGPAGYYDGGTGGAGRVLITWTSAANPTCTVTVDANPITSGQNTTLHWNSTNVTTMYINNVGYVTPNIAGQTNVAPTVTTDYSCTGTGYSSNATFGL